MEKTVKVNLGTEIDPSKIAKFVQMANQYSSSVYIEMDAEHRVNAKSIMGMMNFLAVDGQEVIVKVQGQDEEQAAEAVAGWLMGKE